MKKVFVSCQDVDSIYASVLINRLQKEHFQVDRSPRNPAVGEDSKWTKWQDEGLPNAIDTTDTFIIVIDFVQDSSTWLMIEADEAMKRFNDAKIKRLYYYNPESIEVEAIGAKIYLKEPLPNKLDEIIAILNKL